MAIDPSIILGIKAPQFDNPLDVAKQAQSLQSLGYQNQMQQREMQNQQDLRNAYSQAMTAGPDGTPTLDKQKLGAALQNNPMLYQDTMQKIGAQEAAANDQKLKVMNDHIQARKVALNQIPVGNQATPDQKQAAWTSMIQELKAAGLPTDMYPAQHPGDPAVLNMNSTLQSAESKLEQQNKDRDFGLKQQEANNKKQELAIERYKTFGGDLPPPGGQTPSAVAPKNAGSPASQSAPARSASQPLSDIDPAQLVRTHVPPALQAKAFDQIEAAQNTAQNAPKILEAFDKAANNLHAVDFVPGMDNADQKALHALMGPTFKDVEGTVRQAAMDNMNKNTTPQFGDDANTVKTKRAALEGYLKSKSAAPVLKGFGIDLEKHKSTNYSLQSQKPQSVIQNGHTYTLNAKTGEYE